MYQDVSEAYNALKSRNESPDTHLWLYAKHHYIQRDVWKEVRWLVGARCLIEPEHIKDGDILLILGNFILPALQSSSYQLQQFLGRLSPSHMWHFTLRQDPFDQTPERYEDRLLGGYLSIMHMTAVKDGDRVLIPMCDPDPMLLPTTTLCPNGGEHEEGTDGINVFCKKCYQSLE